MNDDDDSVGENDEMQAVLIEEEKQKTTGMAVVERKQNMQDNLTIGELIKSMWRQATNRRFLYFVPQLFWTGVSIAFYSGNLEDLLQDTIEGDEKRKFELANYAMIAFGFGEIFGCFFIGYVVDKFGSKVAGGCNIVIMSVMTLVTIAYTIIYEFSYLGFVMCFLWGFQDSAVNTHAQEILGFEFDNNSEPFSIYNILQCIACAVFSMLEILVDTNLEFIIFTTCIGLFGIFCCSTMMFFDFREETAFRDFEKRASGCIEKDEPNAIVPLLNQTGDSMQMKIQDSVKQ